MKQIWSIFVLFLFVLLWPTDAVAQAQRTFVSGLGSDGNPCSRTAPCRTISQALMGTSSGGEVIVLDSAGYGPVTITQAVSIIAPPGVYAGLSVFSGDGIDINAGPTDTVILRGLTLNNQGSLGHGVVCNGASSLRIEGCVINGFGGFGVNFLSSGSLEVKDSILRGNNVIVVNGKGTGVVEHCRLETNGEGLDVIGGSRATVRNSLASGNNTGFDATSPNGAGAAELNIENCVVSNSFFGITASRTPTGGAATVRVSNSTVTDNNFGLATSGSGPVTILSRGNNTVEGNVTDKQGMVGSYTAK
ncbi:MAG TPA: right-handed parallel beta-helix repeat-containing protein [Blastocatellia bacterium]|jgi:hypothetical protein|nr:right-handed parallel beta-helix repeat-containing protein [Blastocatellia bacterium]